MKHAKTLVFALALTTLAGWAAVSFACGDKQSKASAASAASAAGCTAEQAAQCTPAQAAACKFHGASAVTAIAEGASGCTYHDAAVKGVKAAKSGAVTAANGKACCAAKTTAAVATTVAGGSDRASVIAVPVGGSSCQGQGAAKLSGRSTHAGCDGCAEMAGCDSQLEAAGAVTQVVALKNGVMLVYTASTQSGVLAVQSALAHRNERMALASTAGDKLHLCDACRAMRGAAASGKLRREVVNIEGGCLTLMTSSDPAMVAKIYRMAGLEGPARIKS